ncbi:MAG: prolipoprotein diacylglyceryl transferase [Candidatus Eisenbacteria bacterium]|nr:prolipoprotein diacylglyceryl transferase [Candidatus Eisenbacteria bacterium]
MFPELFHLGPIQLHSYGAMMAIAFLVGTALGLKEAKRLGLDEDKLLNVILVSLVAAILGARALYVMEHLQQFRREWGSVLALWQGGLTLYGGIVAGSFAGLVAARRMGLPRWKVADALTPALAIGTMFGRVGCFLNGCCYGKPTLMPWGVRFPHDSFAALEYGDTPVQPSQLYNAAVGLVLFLVLWLRRKSFRVPGVMFWTFIMAFALARVGLDMTRTYETESILLRTPWLELTESQITSIAMALFGMLMIMRLRNAAPPAPVAPKS